MGDIVGTPRRSIVCVLLAAACLGLAAGGLAQDAGSSADDPFVFFTPGLAVMDRRTDNESFFNSIDSTLVIPFSPNTSALATFSLQFNDKPRWTGVGNYDWFLDRETTLRLAGGLFDDQLGVRVTAFQPGERIGKGLRLGMVSGDFEVGGFVTLPFAWGLPLRRESAGERLRGRDRVTDLGASTAVALSLRGDSPQLGTEPEYFFPRDAEWPRFGQGAQGQSASAGGLPSKLEQTWVTKTGGPVRSSAALADQTVYVGSDDGYLYALDLETGELRWRYRLAGAVASSPAAASGRIFVGDDSGMVYCLLAEGDKRLTEDRVGLQLWRIPTGGPVTGSPLVTLSGNAVFGSGDGSLYAVKVVSGQPAWTYQTGAPISASPVKSAEPLTVVSADGKARAERDVIYCAGEDGHLYALAERDGSVLWQVDTGAPIRSTPVAWAQKVFLVNEEGKALALSGRDGREAWSQHLPSGPGGSPTLDGKRLIIPLRSGSLVGLNVLTGETEWSAQVPGRIYSTPISTSGPVIYVGSTDGHLYALDKSTGEIRWDFVTGDAINASPAAAHGQLVVGSRDGSIYAFGDRTPAEGVATNDVSGGVRVAATQLPTGAGAVKPPPLPNLSPVKRAWTPPPGWVAKPDPPSIQSGAQEAVAPVPQSGQDDVKPPPAVLEGLRMRLTSEPADAAELPIDLTNQRETRVTWGTTEPAAEVDGETVENRDGRIEVTKRFDDDGTYPVLMVTGKGTDAERIACRLVIVDTTAEPTAPREVAFTPDADGIGDTIAFRPFAEWAGHEIAVRIVDIRNTTGKAIRTWTAAGAGENTFIWDGRDLAGDPAPAAAYVVTYTVRDSAGNSTRMTQRVLLQRAGERTAGS